MKNDNRKETPVDPVACTDAGSWYDHAVVCGYAFFGIMGDFPCSKQICPADSFPLF